MYCKSWKEIKIDYKFFIKYWKECYNYHAQPLHTSQLTMILFLTKFQNSVIKIS